MRREEAIAAIEWLVEMGADEVVGDAPVNRLAPMEVPPPPVEARERPSRRPTPRPIVFASSGVNAGLASRREDGVVTGRPIDDARAIAAACQSLADISAALSRFDACPLKRTATNLALCDGNPSAHVTCIGEAPGRDEDLQGKPFVGRSGQLLDRMLAAIGLSRHDQEAARSVFITNVIFWRPPGNRTPTEQETLMCLPFLRRMIEVLRPRVIVCVGAIPTQRLTGRTDGILKLRGKWFEFDQEDRRIPMLATLHPAYLLRQPAQKRLAWRDLLSLRKVLDAD